MEIEARTIDLSSQMPPEQQCGCLFLLVDQLHSRPAPPEQSSNLYPKTSHLTHAGLVRNSPGLEKNPDVIKHTARGNDGEGLGGSTVSINTGQAVRRATGNAVRGISQNADPLEVPAASSYRFWRNWSAVSDAGCIRRQNSTRNKGGAVRQE